MSNKRSLHMFQQGSPKRRKSEGLQIPDSVQSHHKYPVSDPHSTQQQHSNYHHSYHNFQPNQTNMNNNFYNVPATSNSVPAPRPFHKPPNNLGYNPNQAFTAQTMSAQTMPAQTMSAQTMSAQGVLAQNYPGHNMNSSHPGVRIAQQNQSFYSGGNAHGNQALNNRGNSIQTQNNVMNNLQNNNLQNNHQNNHQNNIQNNHRSGNFEDKSLLYRLNHQDPGPQSYQPNLVNTSDQYQNPGIRYYQPPESRYGMSRDPHQPAAIHHPPPSNNMYTQNMTSASAWDYSVPPPVPNHRPQITGPGNQTTHNTQFNNISQNQSFPNTEYKIDPACHQRQISKNSCSDLNKSGNKSGEKRKEGGKLACGKKRLITCNISALLHWAKLKQSSQFLFEIFACLRSAEQKSGVSYKLELRDGENNELNADYYLSSAAQTELVVGKYYRLVGKMMNSSFHCFKLKEVPYMETRNAMGLIKQSEIAMSKLILQINET